MPRAEPKVAELMTSHIGHTVVAGVHYWQWFMTSAIRHTVWRIGRLTAVETQTSRYRICPTTAIVGR